MKKYIFIIFSLLLVCCNKHEKQAKDLLSLANKIGPDYLIQKNEYIIDMDYKYKSASIYKIFTKLHSLKNRYPDFDVENIFQHTFLRFFWTQDYVDKIDEYIEHYINFTDQEIISDIEKEKIFYKIIEDEIVIRRHKDVFVAYSKDDLNLIENSYINSKYLKEMDSRFFDNNILILIIINHSGWTYPKNWELLKYYEKNIFKVEIWDPNLDMGLPYMNNTLFLIKIEK
jgi:hypothetical protein